MGDYPKKSMCVAINMDTYEKDKEEFIGVKYSVEMFGS